MDSPDAPPSNVPDAAVTALSVEERAGKTGPDIIKAYAQRLPGKPGVYRMIDRAGDVLYVGKAKNLKNRVMSYVRSGGHTRFIAKAILDTATMEFVVTDTETEALLLECNLIKKMKPKYNILLRDDKSFPYILVRRDHAAPQILKHRGARSTKGQYYGPFASAGAVNRTLNTLQKAFLLRTCSDSYYENRTRPCMLHQIKRCAAPCVDYIALEDYGALVQDADAFLSGKSDALRKRLQAQMEEASEALEFERAAQLRNRIRALAPITAEQGINPAGVEEADVVAVHSEGGQSCIQVFFFRAGQNWGDRAVYPRHDSDATPAQLLEAFLGQFYEDKPAPKLILTSHTLQNGALLEEALTLRAGRKVVLAAPQRGEKAKLVAQAVRNAEEALARRMAESAAQARLLDGVAHVFGLDERPHRIEVYDNSHIQGAKAVGAMIVAGPEGFEKRSYRTYNIKAEDLAPGDDYAMMREVIARRFARLAKVRAAQNEAGAQTTDVPQADGRRESPAAEPWPDLVLIDGGKGQLSAVLETLQTLGLSPQDITIAAIAKGPDRNAGREQFFMPGRPSFQLPPNNATLYYLQRLRDEAHRFAITTHRSKRSRDIAKNPLDDIPGVGPARKRALLEHFGSARSVKRAARGDLEKVEGVSKQLARKIYDWFREN